MNLTGGQFKGIKIDIPNNARPTLSKVRQGVFNILSNFEFENNTFLDMFSGSGLMSLEALSRGYDSYCIELNSKNAEIIKKNYKKINKIPNLTIKNALQFKSDEKFEIIYLDPPWNFDYAPIIKKSLELLDKNGIIIVEYDSEEKINLEKIINDLNLDLEIIKSKKYGRCLIDILTPKA